MAFPSCSTSQCAGISPSHSMPESFIGIVGSRPLVTARVMRALPLLLQQFDQLLLLLDEIVYGLGFPVQEIGDDALFEERRSWIKQCS